MKMVFEDVRIIDLTHVFFGPFCTKVLAEMGAEVIKIEPPWGELSRFRPPLVGGASTTFLYLDTSKKGLVLNLKNEKGVNILKELVKISDVIVENFRPGTMARLGLSYENLVEVNPRIIYASLSGFGQTGPYSLRPSYASIAEAMSGYMRLTGDTVDPKGPPIRPPEAYGDLGPALWAALSVMAAIRYRDKTGKGQKIDVAQTDCMVTLCGCGITTYVTTGMMPWERREKFYGTSAGGIFKASDGYITISGIRGRAMDRLIEVMGVKEIESRRIIEDWVGSRTVDEVVGLLVDAEVPVAPVLSIDETIQDPHVLARGMMVEVEHPQAGRIKMPNFPVKFSEMRGEIRSPAPLLGQHTDEILSKLLNYSQEDIKKLREEGVI